jgi:hypothetical protein
LSFICDHPSGLRASSPRANAMNFPAETTTTVVLCTNTAIEAALKLMRQWIFDILIVKVR